MVSISTYGGWAGIAVIGAGYWYLQSRRTTNRPNRPVTQKQASKSGETHKDGRAKKQRIESAQSGGEQGSSSHEKSQKKRKQTTTNPSISDATPVVNISSGELKDGDDGLDNREFARQFQNAKSGTITTSKPQAASRQKSIKQSQAKDTTASSSTNGVDTSSNDLSNTLSFAGVDADDDLSAANSPSFGATTTQPLRSGDVSDMLEAPSLGPAVLRITEPAIPSQPWKEKRPVQSSESAETKKQRQNRKKAEARKEIREEEERERRVLLEKQRRTAREAEGRAAKDGSSFMATKPPVPSVWVAPSTVNDQVAIAPRNVEPLDTYEPNTNGTSPSANKDASNRMVPQTNWDQPLPSEEEQMRLLEEETAWNTVISKKGKKKGGEPELPTLPNVVDNGKNHSKATESSGSKRVPTKDELTGVTPVTIVGDPSIDISRYSHNGGPVNAILENGDGHAYGYTLADDEWEVA